ncbi:MAG: hypothetical protein HYS06_10780 [Methylocystis sp.]|nr:hypothetical protein [Methylocystis sp.]MBI3274929.1 hypothetical protein [Methylocystis sp.]
MNRIVKHHYPAAKLPDDLRNGLDAARDVTITIETEDEDRPEHVMTIDEMFAARTPPFRTKEEIDEDLRRDREEWDR